MCEELTLEFKSLFFATLYFQADCKDTTFILILDTISKIFFQFFLTVR